MDNSLKYCLKSKILFEFYLKSKIIFSCLSVRNNENVFIILSLEV